jgi:hypothetical protein
MREQESTTPLPGVFATISAGFDLITKHLWLLLFPVIFDIFYWLGPRLRFQTLIEQFLEMLPAEGAVLDLPAQLTTIAPQTNLFTTLSVQLIGIPALMVGLAPETTPIEPQVIELESWLSWFGLFVIFSVVGLLVTAIFYTLIASAISKQTPGMNQMSAGQWGKRAISSWVRLIGLVILFLFIAMILYTPLIIIGSVLLVINPALGSIAALAGIFLMSWVVIALSMAPFGIVLNGRPVVKAVVESTRLVQTHLPSVLYLLIAIFFIGVILDWLLFAVENGTWLTLINIAGHAFVSTALVAAVFIFYRDRYKLMFDPNSSYEIQTLQGNEE